MSILDVVQSQSHSILSINYRLQIIELIKTTEFELKHGFGIAFRHINTSYTTFNHENSEIQYYEIQRTFRTNINYRETKNVQIEKVSR